MGSPASADGRTGVNRRVLVIDDNLAIHGDYNKILVGRSANGELDALTATLFDSSAESVNPVEFEVTSAYQGQEGLALVQQALEENRPFAMAFVDMRMPPGWDGLETIKRIWEVDPNLQIVISSAYSDHSWSELVDSLAMSSQWLLLRKPFDSAEVSQLALALTQKWELERQSRERVEDLQRVVDQSSQELKREMQDRLAAQESQRESDARFRAVFESAQDGILIFDDEGMLEAANAAAHALLEISSEDLETTCLPELLYHIDGSLLASSETEPRGVQLAEAAHRPLECRIRLPQGKWGQASVSVSEFVCNCRRMFTAMLHDLSDGNRPQDELAADQQLEVVS
jgi:PAS domain S-box-containing protein